MENIVHKGKLEELTQRVKVGFVGTCEKYYTDDSGIPMLRTTNLKANGIELDDLKYVTEEFHNKNIKSQLHDGDVLVARFGTSGQACVYHGGVAQCLNAIIIEPKLDICVPEYLALVINSDNIRRQINKKIVGSTQNILNTKVLSNIEIELPSIEEQTYILSVFSKVNNVLMNRTNELQLLDNLIKARFVELFGDVKSNTFMWEKCTFDDVTSKITDGEHGTVPRVEEGEGYLYFMARNITKDGLIDLSETSYVPEDVHQKIYKRCNPELGDILLVCVGATIGKSALVTENLGEFSMARSVALLKPDTQKVNSIFLINLLKSDAIQNDISNCAHTAAQAGLYTNMIKSLDAFLPPLELQNQFADFVKQVYKSKVAVQKVLAETQVLFDSLMQQYFG